MGNTIVRSFIVASALVAAACGSAPTPPSGPPVGSPPPTPTPMPGQTLVATSGQRISDVTLTSTSGPCVLVSAVSDVWIDNAQIGPCAGQGVLVTGASRIRITNSTIHTEHGGDAGVDTGDGIRIQSSNDVLIQGNQFSNNETSVEAFASPNVRIIGNYSLNPLGPKPRGQHFQLTNGSDGGRISDNFGEQNPRFRGPVGDRTFIADGINIFQTSSVIIERNYLRDGDDDVGCGIIIGDNNGGSPGDNHTVAENILIRTSNCGIGVAGGMGHTVVRNKIFDTNFDGGSGNVGLYVWDYRNLGNCADIIVRDNVISNLRPFPSGNLPAGAYWDYWNAGNCRNVTFSDNVLGAAARDILAPPEVKLPPPPIPPVRYNGTNGTISASRSRGWR